MAKKSAKKKMPLDLKSMMLTEKSPMIHRVVSMGKNSMRRKMARAKAKRIK